MKTQETLSTPIVSSKILGKRSKPSSATKSKISLRKQVSPKLKGYAFPKSLRKELKPEQTSEISKDSTQLQKEKYNETRNLKRKQKRREAKENNLSQESIPLPVVEPSSNDSKVVLIERRNEILSGLKDLLKAEAQIFSFQREAELRIAQQSVELLQNYD